MKRSLLTIALSIGCVLPIQAATVFFTQTSNSTDVFFATFNPAGSGSLTGITGIGFSQQGADGIVIGPNNTVIFGGEGSNAVFQIPQSGIGAPISATSTTESFFLSVNQNSPGTLFNFNNGGSIATLPIVGNSITNGTLHTVTGPDTNVSNLFWSSTNTAYYLTGTTGTTGDLGLFNVGTFQTSAPLFTGIPTAQEAIFDPFTGLIVLFGEGQVDTFDPSKGALGLGTPVTLPGATAGANCGGGSIKQLNAGTVDGAGHAYVAGCGTLYYIDYSATGDILSLLNVRESVSVPGGEIKDVAVLPTSGTPEPSTIAMTIIGLAGLALSRKFKSNA
jgi:hypothetical protein